jgi:NlpC/P60 family putative phage cell wall peptidase
MRREAIVTAARGWLGTPYRHQAATLGAGCDCLGLLRGVWRALYGDEPLAVPNYRADWRDGRHAGALLAAAERLLLPVDGELEPGQVVLFRLGRTPAPRHCGILIAADRFIHAQEGLDVVEANMSDGWRRRLAGRYDFPGVN